MKNTSHHTIWVCRQINCTFSNTCRIWVCWIIKGYNNVPNFWRCWQLLNPPVCGRYSWFWIADTCKRGNSVIEEFQLYTVAFIMRSLCFLIYYYIISAFDVIMKKVNWSLKMLLTIKHWKFHARHFSSHHHSQDQASVWRNISS
jgi:hypothetical protein